MGFWARGNGGSAVTQIFVTRSTINGVVNGLHTDTVVPSSALVSVSNSMITNNNFKWNIAGVAGSFVESAGNNHFSGNGSSVGTLTNVGLQ